MFYNIKPSKINIRPLITSVHVGEVSQLISIRFSVFCYVSVPLSTLAVSAEDIPLTKPEETGCNSLVTFGTSFEAKRD